MKMLKKYTIYILFILCSTNIVAQGIDTTAFNASDREVLLKEIEKVLTQFKREDCEITLDELKKAVKNGIFGEQHYAGFLQMTDIMVKRKMKRYNFIQPLLNIMLRFADNTNESGQHFDRWVQMSLEILNDQEPKNT